MSEKLPPNLLEASARKMRDAIYGIPSTDANWEGCRENWLRPDSVKWLQERVASMQSPPKVDANPKPVPWA